MKTLNDLFEAFEKIEAIVTDLNNSNGMNIKLCHPCRSEEDVCYTSDFITALHKYLYIDLSLWKDEFTSPEVCKKAVEWFGDAAIPFIPKIFLSDELYMLAFQRVSFDKYYFKRIPRKFKTPELCLAAVRWDQFALQYVPKHLKTLELCVAALMEKNRVSHFNGKKETAINYVPLEILEQVLEAVRKDSGVTI